MQFEGYLGEFHRFLSGWILSGLPRSIFVSRRQFEYLCIDFFALVRVPFSLPELPLAVGRVLCARRSLTDLAAGLALCYPSQPRCERILLPSCVGVEEDCFPVQLHRRTGSIFEKKVVSNFSK